MSDTDADDQEAQPDQDEKPWYPYITKTQFEKFLSRLHGKIPEEIDRDYVRAIIRTPSMIYRFLRGIEAMKLIDHEQRPTERLAKLVEKETRREMLSDVIRDLYPELLKQWEGADSEMSDRDIVSFFRKETGMGNDSANKMKMFFKYLLSESDITPDEGGDTEAANAAPEAEETPAEEQPPTKAETKKAAAEPAEAPADNGRNGGRERGGRAERRGSGRDRGDRSERNDRSDRGERSERGERGGRDRDRDRGDRDRDGGFSNRPVTEAQRAYLDTLKAVLRVNVDGDWDDDMIRLAFDRLERIFDRVRRG
ncbi:MAG: DUF5343 domain-containing protein [Candidatus Latescibacterota bacterium]|nr:DUF5343 domain-containing protein [Candidatus Latescibacterota bacterium]